MYLFTLDYIVVVAIQIVLVLHLEHIARTLPGLIHMYDMKYVHVHPKGPSHGPVISS